jgi:integrase-like protein
VRILRLHQRQQERHRVRRDNTDKPYLPSRYVFTRPDGAPFHPGYFTQRLRLLIDRAGLPPVRLHDLRHGAASLAHSAGVDIKTIQDQLGHSTIALTADVYTSVLPAIQRKAAEDTVQLILDIGCRTQKAPIAKRTSRRPQVPRAGLLGPVQLGPAQNPADEPRRPVSRSIARSHRKTRKTRSR